MERNDIEGGEGSLLLMMQQRSVINRKSASLTPARMHTHTQTHGRTRIYTHF